MIEGTMRMLLIRRPAQQARARRVHRGNEDERIVFSLTGLQRHRTVLRDERGVSQRGSGREHLRPRHNGAGIRFVNEANSYHDFVEGMLRSHRTTPSIPSFLICDRSFIMDLEHSADARAVVDAVIKLAHALGLKVVAEGVENQRQQQVLVQMGCDELQGFLFAKPMSGRALLLWAINDRQETAVFKPSLFDETRQSEPV